MIMYYLCVLLSSLIIIIIDAENNDSPPLIACDGVIFNHVYYHKELIIGNLGRPYNLVMHKFSGILFFSHTIQYAAQVDFAIMACHVAKKICIDVKTVPGGYAVAYDPGNDDIYMGGHDGIYKYNFMTKEAELFGEAGKSIWGLFIRRNFYYIEYPSQKLSVYRDDRFVQVAEARNIEVDHFYIAKFGDIYLSNKTALYKVPRPSRNAVVLNDEIVLRQISEDGYGDLYFCGSNGIYIEDKPYNRIKRVAHIEQTFGLTFDERDYPIFSDENAIYRLVPSNVSSLCYEAISRRKADDARKKTVHEITSKPIQLHKTR